MKLRLAAGFFLLALVAVGGVRAGGVGTVAPGAPGTGGRLRWQNGETLPGEIAGATEDSLTWKTPLFEDGLVLDWSALRRFDQPLATKPPSDPFAFVLRDGGHLYGELLAITPDTVAIRSARHGDVQLRRAEVLSVRRLSGDGLLANGPAGTLGWDLLSNWKSVNTKGKVPGYQVAGQTGTSNGSSSVPRVAPLATGPGGALLLPYWNTGVFQEMALPEKVDLEFRIGSTRRPDFLIALEGRANQSLRIETWDDQLVLMQGEQFVKLASLADTERSVALRVCWDRATNRIGIYKPAGEVMTELFWAAPGPPPGKADFHSALVLQNKGRDLALEFLRVRAWDGAPPPRPDPQAASVELVDGRTIPGEIAGASDGSVRLRVGGASAVAGIPLGQVAALVFSRDAPALPSDPAATLTWADGTFLTGAVENIADGRIALKTPSANGALAARTDGLRQLLLRPAPAKDDKAGHPLDTMDKITAGDTALHGRLICTGDDQPRWLPIGSRQAARPARGAAYEIDRALPPGQQEGQGAPALFYTTAGDILPGSLRALDRTGVDIDSAFVEARKLGPTDLNAIQFSPAPHTQIDGFDDPGWQVVKGNPKTLVRKEGALTMEPGTMLGHPSAMQCSEFKLTLETNSFCALRLRMFCAGVDPAHSINLVLMQNGQTLYYGLENAQNQLESQQEAATGSGPANIRLVVADRQVDFYLNGARLQSFPTAPSRRAGNGLILEPASLWGNSVQSVQLSGFSARFVPGHVGLPEVNAEAKTQALTVPRFRRDDPPRQVLIAANGDVLRGELEAATARDFAFRSGLESLTVPRDRVKAAVWLKKPLESAPSAEAGAPAQSRLDRKLPVNGQYGSMGLRNLMGILTQSDEGLNVKYPKHEPNQKVRMRFDEPTLGEALDQICTAFDLRYRLEGGDTVVLEAVGTVPDGMTRQTYWLKADAFPGPGSAQDALSAKGITFPEDAAVRWEADARQLVMTNTEDNQRKLAETLRADFGGSQGAPTHWLALSNGARLGLAVDRFEPDRIIGHHPLYGRCDVPLAAVYAIRTTAPEENPAMKGFADWRLAYAPEPVLPEAGGDRSALLGKEPKTFKLPLLDGGEFDLAKEKGKVVVLDFWATWCGPCVQSLPGLIEAMSAFPEDKVRFVGLDQAEPPAQVKRFLETRGWKLTVAMDAAQNIGQQFGADAIPLTVIIGPDGKVAWVRSGYQPGNDEEAAGVVTKLLAGEAVDSR